ncbi:hypothetical protein QJQ45_000993 [Haematococcus lacustris]|nr:hypothetical protein QJQ45_000993 [Haematococcus lacustris]
MVDSAAPAIGEKPILLYSWICPYVQRVTLALAHKKLSEPIEEVPIDLGNKPSWLPQLSPHGKVPAVAYKEGEVQLATQPPQPVSVRDRTFALYESLALLDWVDHYFSKGPALMPANAGDRALCNILISRLDAKLVPAWYQLLMGTDSTAAKPLVQAAHAELDFLEQHMSEKGPFLMGAQPSLVDAAVAPWLLRGCVLKHWRKLDLLAGHPKLQAWLEHYRSLPEVQATLKTDVAGEDWEQRVVAALVKSVLTRDWLLAWPCCFMPVRPGGDGVCWVGFAGSAKLSWQDLTRDWLLFVVAAGGCSLCVAPLNTDGKEVVDFSQL